MKKRSKLSVFGVNYPVKVGFEEIFFASEEAASKFVEIRILKNAEIIQYDLFSIDELDLID